MICATILLAGACTLNGSAADTGSAWEVLPSSRFEVTSEAGGFLAALSHEHRIVARSFRAVLRYRPGDPSADSVEVDVPVDSLEVRTEDASPAQLHAIREHMLKDVLHVGRYPEIRFASRSVEPVAGGLRVTGSLTLEDSTRTVSVLVRLENRGDTLVARGTLPFRQTDFGIEPYSFGFGAIKVKDELRLEFEVRAVAGEP
ncbi:MAG: YceI family protein [Candidatus Palauibacterales bacterium]|nr:YceI family protein [Candidatus Palauibacterales bacterium]MDP2529148.1 YceI family protein [Candidatus Palauibacterales bacterium]MDP2583905.1 YceI family protein [Candidatus Palauibacterales bacterium]